MHILVMYQKIEGKTPKPIIDAQVVPDNELQRYAQRAAELNKDKSKRRLYVIEEVPDNSLTAFMANDRHYDMNKYEALATTLCNKIDELRSDVDLLRSYYNNAAELQVSQTQIQSHDSADT